MPKTKQTLMASIFEVFEMTFYVFLEPAASGGWEHQWMSSINYTGPASGEISVLFSPSMANAMVRNMLNIEQAEVTAKLREDCLKECTNMICGNFLRKYDSSKVFDLSLPRFSEKCDIHGAGKPPEGHDLRMDFTAPEGRLGLALAIGKNRE